MIILLDLNYTLVSNSDQKLSPFSRQVEQEKYRRWLIEFVKNSPVILITARPEKYKERTLERLAEIGLIPMDSYFNSLNLPPPQLKSKLLKDYIFPKYTDDGSCYIAIESNPKTIIEYNKLGVNQCLSVK